MRIPATGMRIVPWSPEIPLDQVVATLGLVPRRIAVRITGGCADMANEDAEGVQELFQSAFDGFRGLLLIGGTRMIRGTDPTDVVFGITEVGPAIRRANPECRVLGVVPRCKDFMFCVDPPMLIVWQGQEGDPTTIVHPDQDIVIVAATPLTRDTIWEDEVACCQYVTGMLTTYGGWKSLLVAYNGGQTTRQEVLSAADNRWPVLLVRGSGRVCDELANDAGFLRQHPSVTVCERDPESLRSALIRHTVFD